MFHPFLYRSYEERYFHHGFYHISCIMYLEPKWPLFLKVNPPKQGRNSNQNSRVIKGFQVYIIYKTISINILLPLLNPRRNWSNTLHKFSHNLSYQEMIADLHVMVLAGTPWKINMKPKNHPIEKENHLPKLPVPSVVEVGSAWISNFYDATLQWCSTHRSSDCWRSVTWSFFGTWIMEWLITMVSKSLK